MGKKCYNMLALYIPSDSISHVAIWSHCRERKDIEKCKINLCRRCKMKTAASSFVSQATVPSFDTLTSRMDLTSPTAGTRRLEPLTSATTSFSWRSWSRSRRGRVIRKMSFSLSRSSWKRPVWPRRCFKNNYFRDILNAELVKHQILQKLNNVFAMKILQAFRLFLVQCFSLKIA